MKKSIAIIVVLLITTAMTLTMVLTGIATSILAGNSEQRLGTGEHSLMLKVGDMNRRYIVHVPNSYDGEKQMPVVIMFHGGGGTAKGAMHETGWAEKADREGFIAVFPEATPPDPIKPSKFGTNGQAWNDGSGHFHAGEKDIPDVAFINAMLDDIIARFAVDSRRIYATGFSNGASMAFRVGVELSSRIAAIAPFAGELWIEQPKLDRPVSLYYITGDADPLNPLEGGIPKLDPGSDVWEDFSEKPKPPVSEYINTWVSILNCKDEPETAPASPGFTTLIYSGGSADTEVRFTTIKGHGHIWPGGVNLLPERLVGKPSDKFKATDAIWEFFKEHVQSPK